MLSKRQFLHYSGCYNHTSLELVIGKVINKSSSVHNNIFLLNQSYNFTIESQRRGFITHDLFSVTRDKVKFIFMQPNSFNIRAKLYSLVKPQLTEDSQARAVQECNLLALKTTGYVSSNES